MIQEPPTAGKVVMKTSKGNMVIELWSRECPKACRNFVQLCLEGYYHGCIFHRIIPDFIVQSGDPANTGDTLETIYGESYPDEVHTRLRFRYRGLIGVASRGNGSMTNGSQFFITLSKQESLSGQHTLFGKLVGDSVYTLSDIGAVDVGKDDRPLGDYPPVIIETIVVDNPFPDILPRGPRKAPYVRQQEGSRPFPIEKPKIAGKKSTLLSFSADDEEDEDQDTTIKSAHDVGDDKLLSSQSFVPSEQKKDVVVKERSTTLPKHEAKEVSVTTTEADRTDSILSEIEKVKAAIRAASSQQEKRRTTEEVAATRKEEDQKIVKRLKIWGETVSKTKTVQPSESSTRTEATLHALLQSAEADDSSSKSVSGSGWLKSAGPVKFAIDSKNAYHRNS